MIEIQVRTLSEFVNLMLSIRLNENDVKKIKRSLSPNLHPTYLTSTFIMSLPYSVTSYFDFSTTASCGGSPIIITSVGTGCNAAIQENTDALVCTASATPGEYIAYSTRCSQNAMDFSGYKRNYVVKSVYTTSDQCASQPLQAFALAADSLCHMNPSGDNSTAYLKTNCNGGQPIWSECSDSNLPIANR